MVRVKSMRTKGKIKLSQYFQDLKEGDSVAVIREASINANFPERLQGRTGRVLVRRGRAYEILLKDQQKEKKFIINPIHLKKIK